MERAALGQFGAHIFVDFLLHCGEKFDDMVHEGVVGGVLGLPLD